MTTISMTFVSLPRLALLATFTLAVSVFVPACGGDDDATPEESIDVEGCEHLQEGPAAPITAGAVADETAPLVAADHRRYDIAVTDTGFVRFAADEATDLVVFIDAPATLTFTGADGTVLPPEETATSSPECTDIKGKVTVPVGVGTVFIAIGPGAPAEVSMVVEEAGHDHEH